MQTNTTYYNNTIYIVNCKCGETFKTNETEKYSMVLSYESKDGKTKIHDYMCNKCVAEKGEK